MVSQEKEDGQGVCDVRILEHIYKTLEVFYGKCLFCCDQRNQVAELVSSNVVPTGVELADKILDIDQFLTTCSQFFVEAVNNKLAWSRCFMKWCLDRRETARANPFGARNYCLICKFGRYVEFVI